MGAGWLNLVLCLDILFPTVNGWLITRCATGLGISVVQAGACFSSWSRVLPFSSPTPSTARRCGMHTGLHSYSDLSTVRKLVSSTVPERASNQVSPPAALVMNAAAINC